MKTINLVFLAVMLCSCAHDPLPNFHKVGPGIYRGGQPSAEGWKTLRNAGVSNVVKLNVAGSTPAGFQVVHFPIGCVDQTIGVPSQAKLRAAVDAIRPGTYVQCDHGQDRTGLVIAMYRVRCGWTRKEAWNECRRLGFHPILRGLCWAWEEFE